MIFLLGIFLFNDKKYFQKKYLIGKASDSYFVTDLYQYEGSAKIFNQMVRYIETSIPAGSTLLVIPEGVMINYLTRHEAPISSVMFNDGEFAAFGEPYFINSLKKHPPDFIVLLRRPCQGQIFGIDWGEKMVDWVKKHYMVVLQLGGEPEKGEFGMKLLKLNSCLAD
jgi:hypothetical protein